MEILSLRWQVSSVNWRGATRNNKTLGIPQRVEMYEAKLSSRPFWEVETSLLLYAHVLHMLAPKLKQCLWQIISLNRNLNGGGECEPYTKWIFGATREHSNTYPPRLRQKASRTLHPLLIDWWALRMCCTSGISQGTLRYYIKQSSVGLKKRDISI